VRLAVTLIAAGLLLAHPAAAFTPERAAIMVDAIRDNGCRMEGTEAPAALEPLGLDSIEVQSFVDILYSADLVSISDDQQTLILADPLCVAQGDAALALITTAFEGQETTLEPWRPDFPPERGAALIGIVRSNGCGLTEEQAGQLLPGEGFDPVLTRDIVSVLLDTDMASFNPENGSIQLSEMLCTAETAGDLTAMTDAVAVWIETNVPPVEGAADEGDQ